MEKLSKKEGTSINQFVVMAVAEKVSAINTTEYFTRRGNLADLEEFDRIMNRKGGQPPARNDVLPD